MIIMFDQCEDIKHVARVNLKLYTVLLIVRPNALTFRFLGCVAHCRPKRGNLTLN